MLVSATNGVGICRVLFGSGDFPTRGHELGEDHRQQDEGSAQVAAEVQDFVEEEEGQDGGKDRFQGKDQADLLGSGIFLRDGLYHKAVGAAHQPQADDGAPFHRSGGQGGGLEQAHGHGRPGRRLRPVG